MAIEVKYVGKVVVLGYDPEVIKGNSISVQADEQEKRNVDRNEKHEVNVFYPTDFTGVSNVTLAGSKSGEESATIVIDGGNAEVAI